jgi:hypothetical protein
MGRTIDTMTIIKSICSGVGALSAVLICASVIWSEVGDLDDKKLDTRQFDQYVSAEKESDRVERESDRVYREANAKVQERMFKTMEIIQTDVKTLLGKQ